MGDEEKDALRTSDSNLSHRKARPDLAVEKRLEPAVLLSGRAVASEDLCEQGD
jgi:hypothetical protein